MSDHDKACTCDRCQMMVMPTSRTASERVLHEWTDSESIIRIVEDDRGFFGWSAESGIVTDLIPTVFCRELARLAARVSELELDREGRIRSSDYDKALIEELEAENAKLKESVERMVRIYHEQRTELDNTREERNNAQYEAVEAKAENARLRKCVEPLQKLVEFIELEGPASMEWKAITEWTERGREALARAEVDNG